MTTFKNLTLSPLDLEGENGPVHLPAATVDGGTGDRPGEVTDTPKNRVKPEYIEMLKAFGQVQVLEDRGKPVSSLPPAPAAPKAPKKLPAAPAAPATTFSGAPAATALPAAPKAPKKLPAAPAAPATTLPGAPAEKRGRGRPKKAG